MQRYLEYILFVVLYSFPVFSQETSLKKSRIDLYRDTQSICEQGGFDLNGKRIELNREVANKMIRETTLYTLQPPLLLETGLGNFDTIYEVVEVDTFDLAEHYQKEGLHPVALNMANPSKPGGGVENGSSAQEESLFRRSNYFQSLYPQKNKMYPIACTSVIYSPSVQVFREEEGGLREPFRVDLIACAFYSLKKNKPIPKNYEENTRDKIRNILRVAYLTGHDAIVLGAIGCGSFANDPCLIAKWFKEELHSREFLGKFKKVGFGIRHPEVVYRKEKLNLIEVFKSEILY